MIPTRTSGIYFSYTLGEKSGISLPCTLTARNEVKTLLLFYVRTKNVYDLVLKNCTAIVSRYVKTAFAGIRKRHGEIQCNTEPGIMTKYSQIRLQRLCLAVHGRERAWLLNLCSRFKPILIRVLSIMSSIFVNLKKSDANRPNGELIAEILTLIGKKSTGYPLHPSENENDFAFE